jgi:N-acyl homoserine lactone hydrolase
MRPRLIELGTSLYNHHIRRECSLPVGAGGFGYCLALLVSLAIALEAWLTLGPLVQGAIVAAAVVKRLGAAKTIDRWEDAWENMKMKCNSMQIVVTTMLVLVFSVMVEGTPAADAGSRLPDPLNAGVASRLYRLDCGHSLAVDQSVWTPGENVGREIEFSSTCWLIKHGGEWLLWDTGVPESALENPRGWSTLPKLIVYHIERSLTAQLAEIGLKPADIGRVAISHTHGDHLGNMSLFDNSTVLMQRVEFTWIHSPDGNNDNVNQLMALARTLLGRPRHLQLVEGDTDVFGDGSVTLVSTPGHTPGHQSLLVHLRHCGFILLSGDVAHTEENFRRNIVPSLNTDQAQSIASMRRVRQLIATYNAAFFINHDKSQSDKLRLLPAFYD